jgi:hypothetical protein
VKARLSYMAWFLLLGVSATQGLAREAHTSEVTSIPKVRVQMSLVRPLGYPNLAYYKPLYGQPRIYPQAGMEWLFLSHPRFQLGLGGSLGFSVANGSAGVGKKGTKGIPAASDIDTDPNSPCSLTMIPYRVLLSMTTYPFAHEILGFGFWVGIEEIYFGETRTNLGKSSSGSGSTTSSDSSNTGDPAGRTGWSKGWVLGASLPILLAGPTSQAVRSMEIMHAHAIHFTPFYERVSTLPGKALWLMHKTDSGLDFSRQNVGIAFSFEFR